MSTILSPPTDIIPADGFNFGIKELASGGDLPTVDIVAIHGLDGHREASFTAPSNGVLWLHDLLPKTIPTARILTYGYDARTRGLEITRSNQALYDLSIDFIAKLSNFRIHTKTDTRPLIFIPHSFGGIMLKSALIYANTTHEEHLPGHKAVALSTYGIIFLGTPHQGINLTDWTHSLLNCLPIKYEIDHPIVKHLGLHSETLQQQINLYNGISSKIHTVFCYETYSTQRLGSSSKEHVPVVSAVVAGSTNTEVIAIHKDHMGLAWFTSTDDDEYNVITQCLLQMIELAPSAILTNWEKHGFSLRRGCKWSNNPETEPPRIIAHQWSSASDPSSHLNQMLVQRQPGTRIPDGGRNPFPEYDSQVDQKEKAEYSQGIETASVPKLVSPNVRNLIRSTNKAEGPYTISVRLPRLPDSHTLTVIESVGYSGCTWTTTDEVHTLFTPGSGTSGALLLHSDNGECALVMVGIDNFVRWCDILTDFSPNDSVERTIELYHISRKKHSKLRQHEHSVQSANGTKFGIKYTVTKGYDFEAEIVATTEVVTTVQPVATTQRPKGSYAISVRLLRSPRSHTLTVVKSVGHCAGRSAWNSTDDIHTLFLPGSGTSGGLLLQLDKDTALVMVGIHDSVRWCDILPNVPLTASVETLIESYYTPGKKHSKLRQRLDRCSSLSGNGTKFEIIYTVAEGHDLEAVVVAIRH